MFAGPVCSLSLSVCGRALGQTQIPPPHAVNHPPSKPNPTQRPDHSAKGSLLSQRAARSPSIFKLFKVRKRKCTDRRWLGWNALWDACQNSSSWDNCPRRWSVCLQSTIDATGQPRVNIPWCLLSKLLTRVERPPASELVYVPFTLQESRVQRPSVTAETTCRGFV